MKRVGIFVILILTLTAAAQAQVATGGTDKIEQSVIASGGATNSTGGTYTLNGATGELIAGTTLFARNLISRI